ncbi:MAG: 30S ribosome-binding factor RbfA [Ignavibacteriae bacterium]|nr:30S ribosome-binding factor RbfA [Ignavibacteriota bacterium]
MSLRTDRVASLIKEEMGLLFTRDYTDPAYGLITVTDVHVSSDLRIAKIYVSILGNHEVREKTMKMLEDNKKSIRSSIGSHLYLKFIPEVQFYIDETLDRVERINTLIKQIHQNNSSGQPTDRT